MHAKAQVRGRRGGKEAWHKAQDGLVCGMRRMARDLLSMLVYCAECSVTDAPIPSRHFLYSRPSSRSTIMQACGDMALLHKLADAHRSSAQQLALLSADSGASERAW